jgi:signal transduction histidine kinase
LEKEYDNLSQNGKENFARMNEGAKRMQTLIDDLLTYSRTNTGERKFENADLKLIVDAVVAELKENINEKRATLEVGEMGHAYVIPFQFTQLFNNLISNSLKFAEADKQPYIKIESEIGLGAQFNVEKLLPEKKYCHIHISDNGIGFEQQYGERIFNVFTRLHGQSEYKGTGIGLAIVKKIVDNHQGIILATGRPNTGADFDIYLPAA